MLLADLLRLRMYVPQQKALHCYLILSVWILLLIGGVYKFLEPKQKALEPTVTSDLFVNLAVDVKTKKIFKLCNRPEDISVGDEGIDDPQRWVLKGVLILIRHGDRGPLQHVKNISFVKCGHSQNFLVNAYKAYLHNVTVAGKVSWTGPGAFHGFPLLPVHATQCQLGQLTMQGVHQLLTLGKMLKERYVRFWPKLTVLNSSDVIVYSTRYRRTFQSALAFLYSLIPQETLSKINIVESQSMNFCFKDCGCAITDKYGKFVQKAVSHQLKSHPAVALLAEATSKSVFPQNAEYAGSSSTDPHVLRDALLTYVCHGSGLPCETPYNCVRRQNVAGIFAYTDWVNDQKWRNRYWQKFCLLKSYGLIKNIVQQMLKIVSGNSPSFVLYSGHDHTLEQLAATLGLASDPLLLRYAARLVFEVYQNLEEPHNGVGVVYFRLLSNGRDVTNQIDFCKQLIVQSSNEVLCKIEDIVRFLHDDYFTSLNSTNFKDACTGRN